MLEKHLVSTPFEYINNRCMIYVNDFSESKELPCMDSAILFEAKHRNMTEALYMYGWENNDVAIAATGWIWGYPK